MKILIISGFLGAGKTTFIKALTRNTGKQFAILENEYGAAGIDGDILKNDLPDAQGNIWEMAEGCICCSMKGDFAASVLTIANSVDPDYLVVEPTGVALLSEVIRNLQQIEYDRIRLLAPITLVDGHSYQRYMQEYPGLYQNQIAAAHTVVVSKMEHDGAEAKEWLEAELKKLNPKGRILTGHYSSFNQEQWAALLEQGYDGERLPDAETIQELPDTFAMRGVSMEQPEQLFLLLEAIVWGMYGNIFRAKGQLRAGDQVFRFDVADGRYSVTGGDPEAEHKVVFIGTDILREGIRPYFYRDSVKILPQRKRKR